MAFLIADASYMVFYTYYAMLKFYKSYFNSDPDVSTIMNSPLFRSKFCKMFKRKIIEIATEHDIPLSNIVFAVDCDRESIWRREVYPDYKSSRSPKTEFSPKAFDVTFESIIPELVNDYGMQMIRVARAEADDVAGVLHRHIRNEKPDTRIVIITNDNDYIQLLDENTNIVNMAKEDISSRKSQNLTASEYLTCKILCGDKSDNLPGAISRCGMKTAEKLVKNNEKICNILNDNADALRRFKLNRMLMDLTKIPEDIQTAIIERFSADDAASVPLREQEENGSLSPDQTLTCVSCTIPPHS